MISVSILYTTALAVLLLTEAGALSSAAKPGPLKDRSLPPSKAAPVVKLDSAMTQERLLLPGGTVQTRTYVNGVLISTARKAPAATPAPHRRKASRTKP